MRQALAALSVLAAVAGAGCSAGTGGLVVSGDVTNGKRLFQGKCASCHALTDVGSASTVGPNLDNAFAGVRAQGFSEGTIREIVADQIKYAVEPMPQNLVTGSDVDDVAAYVASVAGKNGYSTVGGGTTTAAGGVDGKSIFASAGCSGCHTLAAAGSSGTIGPNLDDAKPSLELAVERVTNGKGVMPPFEGELTEAQIRAVAEFVARNAGR